ncbi:MAG TPA: hypothetical protein VH083_09525 [Myxococcales bacterium]|nr:hypothetical protein [Myxococcales bacterium]
MTHTFSFPAGCPDDELQERWESLLGKSPRLVPWLDETLRSRRSQLSGRVVGVEIERVLWKEMSRWLTDFEALPSFAIAAITTTLEEKREVPAPRPERVEVVAESPERSATELEALAADPTFALAFHCVEARIKPWLTPQLPGAAWLGLLHASAPVDPQLTAATAIALVLRLSSASWQQQASETRRAALRLFHLTPADLRSPQAQKLCAPLKVSHDSLPELVATSARLRKSLPEAARLCASLVARLSKRPGGLSLLQQEGTTPATDSEVAELRETARRHTRMAGFDRLLRLV